MGTKIFTNSSHFEKVGVLDIIFKFSLLSSCRRNLLRWTHVFFSSKLWVLRSRGFVYSATRVELNSSKLVNWWIRFFFFRFCICSLTWFIFPRYYDYYYIGSHSRAQHPTINLMYISSFVSLLIDNIIIIYMIINLYLKLKSLRVIWS